MSMRHLRFLRYVDEVARAGSIRKAAEQLHVTASAVNRRVLDLEEELGAPLFERRARGVRLTAAGELFVRYIREQSGALHIGATATHHDVESSPLVRGKCPLLAETASHIGDVQVRNMGTIGGSVAHADPAADYPAALQALEAKIVLKGAKSERTVSAEDFFVDTFTTALEPGEIVREVIVPVDGAGTGTNYQKVLQPASGFAIVGVAVRVGSGRRG